jgi:predicted CoA-binding protein
LIAVHHWAYDEDVDTFELASWLVPPKRIAVVGLSNKPDRPSYTVADYLLHHGFEIVPINPMIDQVFDLKAYPSMAAVPETMRIDIVDIFRRSEEVPAIVQQVLDSNRTPLIWMQEGVISPQAQELAESHELLVVMNQCIMKLHRSMI